jgi:hypothetical protein
MTRATEEERVPRREFLSQLGVIAAVSGLAATASAAGGSTADPAALLPMLQLGEHRVTRLVAGWNPIGGYSYLGPHMDRHMKEYFTVQQTVRFLLDCEQAGINAHQFSSAETTPDVLRKTREAGSRMKFFGLHSGRDAISEVARHTEPFALVHHGGVTDRLFRDNQAQEVHDYVKAVHDQGLLAGVSAHNPDCIRRIADEDWEVDFFMCCFYYLTRKHAASASGSEAQPETLQINYPFYRDDPLTMTEVMRQVRQPCLGFKILGAGRLCANQAMVRSAFQFAFQHIKPTDGVIVGMYPRFFDEVTTDAEYTRELGRA